jgi:hypothetical protein
MNKPLNWVYDLETYPNVFTATFMQCDTGLVRVFEISDWRNDLWQLIEFCRWLQEQCVRLIGFNNVGFDYPVLHYILTGRTQTAAEIYQRVQQIIGSQDKFGTRVASYEVLIPQVDLFLIHHFNNKARATSLKVLEFNMRSHSIEDLPFPVGSFLTADQVPTLLHYNLHDVAETMKFYYHSTEMIEFRDQLTARYGRDFTNHNDTKIGKDYFVMKLEEHTPGVCYPPGQREPRQTHRPMIALNDVILRYVQFDHPELNRVLLWLRAQVIQETIGVFSDVQCTVHGFTFHFGTGGIHGSVLGQTFEADDEWCILDLDVTSYYPSLAIVNRFYPQHLGDQFCDIYADMKAQRVQYKKGSAENAMLKLALNGVYGDSNNPYSPFYDPQYTMSITVNGQLLLCMMAEKMLTLPDLQLLQINTDGMTIRVKRTLLPLVYQITEWWQKLTRLDLEEARYSRMFIRDVNSYIAEKENGKGVKRKGAYEYVLEWHKDHSELIVAKAAEAVLIEGADLEQYIYGHPDVMDFMLRAKVPRASSLELEDGTRLQNTIRYYVSTDGQALFKTMPPPPGRKIGDYKQGTGVSDRDYVTLNQTGVHDPRIHTKNKSVYEARRTGLQVGYKIHVCNDIRQIDRTNINYRYYIDQARLLIDATGSKIKSHQ